MPGRGSLTLLPREAEDFPRGGNHSRPMPQLTPVYYDPKIVFKTENFACGEDCNKKHKAAATLLSSHESKN